jgi:hypothetical protein
LLDGFLEQRRRGLVGKVTHHEPCRARAACIDRLDRRLQTRAIASGDQHIGTLGGNGFRDAEAQPAR